MEKRKKSIFETPLLSSKIKSANVSLFPEAALGYLLGPILALMANGIVNTYLVQYWDKVLGLGTWAPIFETLLPLLSAILIIVGNLVVGKLMERKPSIAGKARPFILVGMPLIAIALLVMFMAPFPGAEVTKENPNIWTLVMVAIGYNLYYAFAYPFYYTSHSSLVNLSTRNGTSRSLLATAQNASQLAAAGLAGMVGPYIVDALDLLAADQSVEAREAANGKWSILMIIMIVCLVLGCLVEFFFTRERVTEEKVKMQLANAEANAEKEEKANQVSTKEQMKICFHDKYWWLIIVMFFFYQFGGMLKNNSASWFSYAFTGGYGLSGTISIVGAIPTALGMLIIWPLSNKFGKANCIKFGTIIAVIGGALGFLVMFNKGNEAAITGISIAAFVIKAIGTVPAMYISLALLADVLDHQEALYGKRTDGFTMSIYGSIMVAMAGIANAIIVGLNNINPFAAHPYFTNTFLFFGGEAICYLIIGVLYIFMNVEKFSKIDQKTIVADQRKAAEARGEEYIEPKERLLLEQAEADRVSEEETLKSLKAKCEKKNLSYEEELAKYNANKEAKAKAAEEKKAQAEKKKAEKEAQKQAKIDAMSAEEKQAYEAKVKAKEEKLAAKEKEIEIEFLKLKQEASEFMAK